jgi:hypothetical protein
MMHGASDVVRLGNALEHLEETRPERLRAERDTIRASGVERAGNLRRHSLRIRLDRHFVRRRQRFQQAHEFLLGRERGCAPAEEDGLELVGEHPAFRLELLQESVDVRAVLSAPADHGDEVAVAAAVRAERQVDVQMPSAADHAVTRFGRETSSPPQFGQTRPIHSAHDRQNVHSKEQISASPSGATAVLQRSHSVRISSAISPSALG